MAGESRPGSSPVINADYISSKGTTLDSRESSILRERVFKREGIGSCAG